MDMEGNVRIERKKLCLSVAVGGKPVQGKFCPTCLFSYPEMLLFVGAMQVISAWAHVIWLS